MPKATVDKDSNFTPLVGEIWPARKIANIHPVLHTCLREPRPHYTLWRGVA